VAARKLNEKFRQQVVAEVNSARRLLADSQRDFYALYRAFLWLRDNPNRDVLLALIRSVNVRCSRCALPGSHRRGRSQSDAELDELLDIINDKLAARTEDTSIAMLASPLQVRLTPFATQTPIALSFPSPPMSPR
jgi:hypothetical protein